MREFHENLSIHNIVLFGLSNLHNAVDTHNAYKTIEYRSNSVNSLHIPTTYLSYLLPTSIYFWFGWSLVNRWMLWKGSRRWIMQKSTLELFGILLFSFSFSFLFTCCLPPLIFIQRKHTCRLHGKVLYNIIFFFLFSHGIR